MDLKSFFRNNWQHFAAIAVFFIISFMFYQPAMNGMDLKQHDIEQWKGMANEVDTYREATGEEALWTNSMFSGMPAFQISLIYHGNVLKGVVQSFLRLMPLPVGILILHMIGFYIFCMFLRIRPLIAVIGAVAFSFASYEIIIIQAGHITKAVATAFMAPALGAFIYAFKNNWKWGAVLFSLFLSWELSSNHLQITYYFAYILFAVGVYFLVEAIRKSELKKFFITSAAVIAAVVVSVLANSGNLINTSQYAKYTIRGENDLKIEPNGEALASNETGLDKDYITNWSYGIGETFTLISPEVKGGGTFQLGNSHHESTLENSDLVRTKQQNVANMYSYWGDQPFTSGPVYLGVVIVLLAFLALIFSKNMIKWPLFIVTVLAVMLSWGKNFMFLTDFFIDYVPGYASFRTVTMILVIAELTVAVLGVIFVSELVNNKEKFQGKKKVFIGAVSGFFVFLVMVKMIGLGDNYTSESDSRQLENIENSILNQIKSTDPQVLQANYGIDVNNPVQLQNFVSTQMEQYEENFSDLRVVRKDIFHSSMNRSLIFTFLSGGILILFLFTSISPIICLGGLLVLTAVDVIPVANNYIGDEERFWVDADLMKYPVTSNIADESILEKEIAEDPTLKAVIDKAEKEAKVEADEKELTGVGRKNFINSRRFQALNMSTNYRVFDFSGGFQSTRASYFHKSIGGYHGAKLRTYNNLIEFHLAQSNEKVYDMLNTKYFIQNRNEGPVLIPRPTAMGNAWFVKRVEKHESPDDEIRALGNEFDLKNVGEGQLLVNGKVQTEATVYGGEKLEYLVSANDTIDVPIRSGLKEGEQAVLVMDTNGVVTLVPQFTLDADTADSFVKFVSYSVTNSFQPKEEVVMLNSEAKKLSKDSFSGEGTIELTEYLPAKLTYKSNTKEKQFAVFSEIYYPAGWTAKIDGKETEILKSNYLLRGIEVPSGSHTIEFEFNPPSLKSSNIIGYISNSLIILAILVLGFFTWKRSKNTSEEKVEVVE